MKNEHWIERLSQHLDGELSAGESAVCEAHLAECPECAGTLEELRVVVEQATALPDLPPERDLWPGIATRLSPRQPLAVPGVVPLTARRRRVVLTVPQLAAAVIALVLFSAGSARLALSGAAGPAPAAVTAALDGADGRGVGPQVVFAGAYNEAISQLEVEFDHRRSELDPGTVLVVEENLAIIDAAIADAGKALEADPASTFLNTHLANSMRQKMDLLRHVAAIERTES